MNRLRARFVRSAVLVSALAVAAVLLSATPALAMLKVNYLRSTNPIAYNLKSLQTTHFYASVDTTGVWADLVVKTPKGDIHVYRGPMNVANRNFWFPAWNGLGPNRTRLPSSGGYIVQLTINRGGQFATAKNSISISRWYGIVSGISENSLAGPDPTGIDMITTRTPWAWVVPGNMNVYVHATSAVTTLGGDALALTIASVPFAWDATWTAPFSLDATHPLDKTIYFRGANNTPGETDEYYFLVRGKVRVTYRIVEIQ